MRFRLSCAAALFALSALVAGCGGGKTAAASLAGRALLNGQPITGGTLTLHSESSGAYSFGLNAEGGFEASELPPGNYTVTVDNEFLDPNRKAQSYKGGDVNKSMAPKGSGGSKYSGTISGASGPAPAYKGKGADVGGAPEGAATVKEGSFVAIPAKFKKKDTSGVTIVLAAGENKKDVEFTGK